MFLMLLLHDATERVFLALLVKFMYGIYYQIIATLLHYILKYCNL
jgi:hypothetical protein